MGIGIETFEKPRDFSKVTLEQCVDLYENFDCITVINDGQIVMFIQKFGQKNP